ncbi:MAG: glycosyltransferase family 2 protein [Firmicutes bacterium]|nr:glycosyltransferase family 2 protein [Bacillota bacterium]
MLEGAATVLIPAFNEEKTIAETVQAVQKIPGVVRIVVIDDGSHDQTAQRAEEAGAIVLKTPKNLGKGGALNLGLTEVVGDFLLLLDADLGQTAREGRKLLESVVKGQADLVIGRFPEKKRKSGFGLVLWLARRLIRSYTGLRLSAPLSGQRALNKKAIAALNGKFAEGFGVEVAMIIDLARQGLIIREIPVEMDHRQTRKDLPGFIHRGKQLVDILGVIIKRLL